MFRVPYYFWFVASLLITVHLWGNTCESRYLPTRSQEDRLSRLRELIQDLLGSSDEAEGSINLRQQHQGGYAIASKRGMDTERAFPDIREAFIMEENYVPDSYDSSSSSSSSYRDLSIPAGINHFQPLHSANGHRRLRRNPETF